jgi:hypothetical protein
MLRVTEPLRMTGRAAAAPAERTGQLTLYGLFSTSCSLIGWVDETGEILRFAQNDGAGWAPLPLGEHDT